MKRNNKKNRKNKIILVAISISIIVIIAIIGLISGNTNIYNDNVIADSNNKEETKNETDEKDKIEVELPPQNATYVVPIFMYHFILDDYGDNLDVENFLKPSTLEEQLKYITENGYQTIFTSELDKLYKYEKPVALTFDDVFVYFYNNAYPLFKKYTQKATLYIITDYINGENYLTEDQIKEMASSGYIEIESHTKNHLDLTTLSDEEQKEQLLKSKERLEKLTGRELTTICYPYGKYDDTSLQIVKDKYQFGMMMTGGVYNSDIHKDFYQIPRIYANRSMTIDTFASYLSQSKVIIYDEDK